MPASLMERPYVLWLGLFAICAAVAGSLFSVSPTSLAGHLLSWFVVACVVLVFLIALNLDDWRLIAYAMTPLAAAMTVYGASRVPLQEVHVWKMCLIGVITALVVEFVRSDGRLDSFFDSLNSEEDEEYHGSMASRAY